MYPKRSGSEVDRGIGYILGGGVGGGEGEGRERMERGDGREEGGEEETEGLGWGGKDTAFHYMMHALYMYACT